MNPITLFLTIACAAVGVALGATENRRKGDRKHGFHRVAGGAHREPR
jgi:hypothetical protein